MRTLRANRLALVGVMVLFVCSCVPHFHRAAVPTSVSVREVLPRDLFSQTETVLLVPVWNQAGGGSTIHDPKGEVHLLGPVTLASLETLDQAFGNLRGPRNRGFAYVDARGGDVAGRSVKFSALLLIGEGGGIAFLRWWGLESWDVYRGTLDASWTEELQQYLVAGDGQLPRPPDDHVLCHLNRPIIRLDPSASARQEVHPFLAGAKSETMTANRWNIVTKKTGWSALCGETLNRDDEPRPSWAKPKGGES